jgi:hypothetical protein
MAEIAEADRHRLIAHAIFCRQAFDFLVVKKI